jgi:hypothetical protein
MATTSPTGTSRGHLHNGLPDVWLGVEKCQSIKAGGETIEAIYLVNTGLRDNTRRLMRKPQGSDGIALHF